MSVFYRPNSWQLPNTALNIYSSSFMFSSIKSQSRYKRSQPHASMHPKMYFSCPKYLLRPLRTDVVNCYTSYFQTQSTTRKHKTLLCVAPCYGTGKQINVNNVIYSLRNAGQSKCTSNSESDINQQICTILLKLVNVTCHLVYWLTLVNTRG